MPPPLSSHLPYYSSTPPSFHITLVIILHYCAKRTEDKITKGGNQTFYFHIQLLHIQILHKHIETIEAKEVCIKWAYGLDVYFHGADDEVSMIFFAFFLLYLMMAAAFDLQMRPLVMYQDFFSYFRPLLSYFSVPMYQSFFPIALLASQYHHRRS